MALHSCKLVEGLQDLRKIVVVYRPLSNYTIRVMASILRLTLSLASTLFVISIVSGIGPHHHTEIIHFNLHLGSKHQVLQAGDSTLGLSLGSLVLRRIV